MNATRTVLETGRAAVLGVAFFIAALAIFVLGFGGLYTIVHGGAVWIGVLVVGFVAGLVFGFGLLWGLIAFEARWNHKAWNRPEPWEARGSKWGGA